ncbi:MAG: PrgI family protein [Candidatus Roizmanbacteria bacterium]|nr:PrgI family protein [Candidatus Roizmanbacteria bacterium]
MEQHAIPRQITSFEFKLIGFLTIKQFIYLLISIPTGILIFYIFPVPILNFLLGLAVAGVGIAFAFIPINDRPMEVWVRNLMKRLSSPTQYFFKKQNPAIYFLKDLVFADDPHRVMSHIDSQQKLSKYLSSKIKADNRKRNQEISSLFTDSFASLLGKKNKPQVAPATAVPKSAPQAPGINPPPQPKIKAPFLTGLVKNYKQTALTGVLIYIKKEPGSDPIRILKTNSHGIFATYNPLPPSEYFLEVKDPKGTFFFDTMKIRIENVNEKPVEIMSKEMM